MTFAGKLSADHSCSVSAALFRVSVFVSFPVFAQLIEFPLNPVQC